MSSSREHAPHERGFSPVGIDADGERLRCVLLDGERAGRRRATAVAELNTSEGRAHPGAAAISSLLAGARLAGRPALVAAGPGERPREAILVTLAAAGCRATVESRADALMRVACAGAVASTCEPSSDLDTARVVVLEIAARRSAIVIGRCGAVELARTLDLGTDDLDGAVAAALGVDDLAARSLESGATCDDDVRGAIAEALRPHFDDCARAVMLALRGHGLACRGAAPQRIVLAGARSTDRTLRERLRRAVGLPITAARSALAPGVARRLDGAWAVATGLAMARAKRPQHLLGVAA